MVFSVLLIDMIASASDMLMADMLQLVMLALMAARFGVAALAASAGLYLPVGSAYAYW